MGDKVSKISSVAYLGCRYFLAITEADGNAFERYGINGDPSTGECVRAIKLSQLLLEETKKGRSIARLAWALRSQATFDQLQDRSPETPTLSTCSSLRGT
jgi:hypothetical protein